jgi:hypothetical protein
LRLSASYLEIHSHNTQFKSEVVVNMLSSGIPDSACEKEKNHGLK